MAKSSLDLIVPNVEKREQSDHNYICPNDIIVKISSPLYINFDDVHAKLMRDDVSM